METVPVEKPKEKNFTETVEEDISRALLIARITDQLRISIMMEARHPFGFHH